MCQPQSRDSRSVVSFARFQTIDGEPLKVEGAFLTHELENTVVNSSTNGGVQRDELGRFQSGERVRCFTARFRFSHQDKSSILVFHRGDPDCTPQTRDSAIAIPGTLVDEFWLRTRPETRTLLQQAALQYQVAEELRGMLQETLNDITQMIARIGAAIPLSKFSSAKDSGILFSKKTEYHVNVKKFNKRMMQAIAKSAKPTFRQLVACLGHLSGTLDKHWIEILQNSTPDTISKDDLQNGKWKKRIRELQATGLMDQMEQIDWSKIDSMTMGGKRLEKFITKSIRSKNVGMRRMIDSYGMLTPDSSPANWQIASMVRLLHYFTATVRKQDRRKELENVSVA